MTNIFYLEMKETVVCGNTMGERANMDMHNREEIIDS